MVNIDITKSVSCSAQQAWNYITDASKTPEWNGSVNKAELQGDLAVGSTVESTASFVGKSFTTSATITEANEPKRYAFKGEKPFPMAISFDISDAGSGATVKMQMDIDPGKFFPGGNLLLKGRITKQMEKDMDALESRLNAL